MRTSSLLPPLLVFTTIRIVLNTAHRMVSPFLAAFARGLGVDLAVLSYLLTARAVTGAVGPFAAAPANRRGRRFGVLFGVGLFTLGAALMAFWPSLPVHAG